MRKQHMSMISLVNYRYIKKLEKLDFDDVMTDFDASSLYSSAMWVANSVYPKLETGFAFKVHMDDLYTEALNDQTFNQDGNESAIIKLKIYTTPDLIIQHLPVKDKVKT